MQLRSGHGVPGGEAQMTRLAVQQLFDRMAFSELRCGAMVRTLGCNDAYNTHLESIGMRLLT